MAIRTGIGKKFLEELPLGIHTLSETGADTIKVAAFGPNAALYPALDTYLTSGEVSGSGYTAGGVEVPLTVVGRSGSSRNAGTQFDNPYVQPTDDTEIICGGVAIRALMIYNASQSNRNILTLDLGASITPEYGIRLKWGLSRVADFNDVLIPLTGFNL